MRNPAQHSVASRVATCLHSALRDAGEKGPLMKKKRPNSLMNSDAKTLYHLSTEATHPPLLNPAPYKGL